MSFGLFSKKIILTDLTTNRLDAAGFFYYDEQKESLITQFNIFDTLLTTS